MLLLPPRPILGLGLIEHAKRFTGQVSVRRLRRASRFKICGRPPNFHRIIATVGSVFTILVVVANRYLRLRSIPVMFVHVTYGEGSSLLGL